MDTIVHEYRLGLKILKNKLINLGPSIFTFRISFFYFPTTSVFISKCFLPKFRTMASFAGHTYSFHPPIDRRTQIRHKPGPDQDVSIGPNNGGVIERRFDLAKVKEVEARERKEETNRKIASQKAISIILRREATKAVIEKKGNSKKLLPRTVLEALHERITALRWESALKVCCSNSKLI